MLASDHRPHLIIAVEIAAARAAFLAADEAGDYETADAHYARLDCLLEEYRHAGHHTQIPTQR